MNAIKKVIATAALVISSTVATAADNEWLSIWEVSDLVWGGFGIVNSERYNNSGFSLMVPAEYNCQMLIAPIQLNEDERDTIERVGMTTDHEVVKEGSVVKVRVDGGEIYTWSNVESKAFTTDETTYIDYSPLNLSDTKDLFAEMIAGTKLIVQVNDEQTDEVSLIGFSKVASQALDICEEKLNNVAVNEWSS